MAQARGLLQFPGLVAYHLVQGIKGERRGQYAAIWVYDSRAAWERLWGTPGRGWRGARPRKKGTGRISDFRQLLWQGCCTAAYAVLTQILPQGGLFERSDAVKRHDEFVRA